METRQQTKKKQKTNSYIRDAHTFAYINAGERSCMKDKTQLETLKCLKHTSVFLLEYWFSVRGVSNQEKAFFDSGWRVKIAVLYNDCKTVHWRFFVIFTPKKSGFFVLWDNKARCCKSTVQ